MEKQVVYQDANQEQLVFVRRLFRMAKELIKKNENEKLEAPTEVPLAVENLSQDEIKTDEDAEMDDCWVRICFFFPKGTFRKLQEVHFHCWWKYLC